MSPDSSSPPEVPAVPGWYTYSGGANAFMFLLTRHGQWYAVMDNGQSDKCAWVFIQQATGVWELVLVAKLGGDS